MMLHMNVDDLQPLIVEIFDLSSRSEMRTPPACKSPPAEAMGGPDGPTSMGHDIPLETTIPEFPSATGIPEISGVTGIPEIHGATAIPVTLPGPETQLPPQFT